MNIRSLKIFKTVCETKNMTEAGKKMHMTQPAVSQTIINLEKDLQVKLFERIKNRLELTYSGRVLYKYSQKIMRLVNESEDMMHQIADLNKGKLRVGASMTIGTYLLPEIINEFKEENKALEMPIVIDNTVHIVDKILNNELDIGFVEGPFQSNEIVTKLFIKDKLCLVAGPSYYSKGIKEVDIGDLNNEDYIMREQGSGTRKITINKFEELNINYNIEHVLNNFEAIKKVVAANMGIAFLPEISVKQEVEAGNLVKIQVRDLKIKRDFKIIYHKDKYHSPFFTHFMDHLNTYK